MAETVEELNVDWEEDGQLVTKTLKSEVLTKGSWTTIMFLYQEMDRKSGQWREPKITIRRYQKVRGNYMQKSKFNMSSANQANRIAQVIHDWTPELGKSPSEAESEE